MAFWFVEAILEDGNISITWEDGSLSDVPADYVRKLELEEKQHVRPTAQEMTYLWQGARPQGHVK